MEFKKITIDDIERIKPYFDFATWRTCDFTVGGMFMWRDYYGMEYCIDNNVFYSRLQDKDKKYYYNIPLSENVEASIKMLIRNSTKSKSVISFCTVPEAVIPLLNTNKDAVSVIEHRELFDYIYDAKRIKSLAGRNFSGQRNLINQFLRQYGDWSFHPIDKSNISSVIDFFNLTYESDDISDYEIEENRMVLDVLNYYDDYRMFGGVLIADKKVKGFSIGEKLHDTLFVHIEKADRDCKGAYQMLVHQFLDLFATDDIKYVNREEDMGDLGLRRSKKSYHPMELLSKYTVEVQQV